MNKRIATIASEGISRRFIDSGYEVVALELQDQTPIIHDYIIKECHKEWPTIDLSRSKDWELPRRKNNYKQKRRSKRHGRN